MKASEKRTEFVEVIKFVNSLHACWLGTVAIQQIQFKILLIAFKSQIGLTPSYIANLLVPYAPSRTLRSFAKSLLTI